MSSVKQFNFQTFIIRFKQKFILNNELLPDSSSLRFLKINLMKKF